MAPIEKYILLYRIFINSNIIDSTIEEIGVGVNLFNITCQEDLEGESSSNPLQRDVNKYFTRNSIQSKEL